MYSKTNQVVLLLGVPSSQGVLSFPSTVPAQEGQLPGLLFTCNGQLPINPQLVEQAESYLREEGLGIKMHIWQDYSDTLKLASGETATVFIARLDRALSDNSMKQGMKTMPEWIRALPKDRSRLLYVRALQVLSGGLTQETKVVELDPKKTLSQQKSDDV